MSKEIPYQNFSSFVMRSPLFPFNFIESVVGGKDTSEEQVREICLDPMVQEAIFLASPDLYQQMQEWLKGELRDKKKAERLIHSMMRYIIRMSSRPTPFGLFAGFNLGKWAEETRVELPSRQEYGRHTRLDMNYLCALALDLAKHPVIKKSIRFYPNSSIYRVGNQLRYVEYRYLKARRTHHIVAVDHSEYLQRVLEAAARGAYLEDLVALLVDEEITEAEAREFIEELIESQLLVNDLEPAITGPEFLDQIMAILKGIPGIDEIKQTVEKIRQILEQTDKSPIGTTIPRYQEIVDTVKPLGTEFELKFMFQTDMIKPAKHCTLASRIAADVLKGMEMMNRLTLRPGTTTLSQFCEAFQERYETREIPLLQALDTECGIGFRQNDQAGDISPLVDDLAVPARGGEGSDLKWDRLQSMLFQKYKQSVAENKFEVTLTEKDLEPFEARWDDLPDTLSAMVQVIRGIDGDNPREQIMITGFGGSSAGNLLGRFCHADQRTFDFVKEIAAKEAELNPDVILAEIIHLPESRLGNILLRPVLRDYEIPYLGKPAVPGEFQLNLADIMVSVQGNRVILRSKRLNKEIIPHLTSAHNYSRNALPIYHFLAELQTQNLRGGAGFGWGALANEYEFLPRVVYQNLVVSPATWNIKDEEIEPLVKINDDEKLLAAVQEWRKKRRIPAYVAQVDADNRLFINLDNLLCIKTLFSVVKNRGGFQLVEFLFDPKTAMIRSAEDVFTDEIIVSFYRTQKREILKED